MTIEWKRGGEFKRCEESRTKKTWLGIGSRPQEEAGVKDYPQISGLVTELMGYNGNPEGKGLEQDWWKGTLRRG